MRAFDEYCSCRAQGVAPVLWIFQDYDRQWRLCTDGDADDVAFPYRQDAVEAAKTFGQMRGAYRLYLQLTHGRFTSELLNTGASKRRGSSTDIEVERTNALSPDCQDREDQAEFSRGRQGGIGEY